MPLNKMYCGLFFCRISLLCIVFIMSKFTVLGNVLPCGWNMVAVSNLLSNTITFCFIIITHICTSFIPPHCDLLQCELALDFSYVHSFVMFAHLVYHFSLLSWAIVTFFLIRWMHLFFMYLMTPPAVCNGFYLMI